MRSPRRAEPAKRIPPYVCQLRLSGGIAPIRRKRLRRFRPTVSWVADDLGRGLRRPVVGVHAPCLMMRSQRGAEPAQRIPLHVWQSRSSSASCAYALRL